MKKKTNTLSEEMGFIHMQLSDLSTNAKLCFIPSQDIQGIASELLLKIEGASKFNL